MLQFSRIMFSLMCIAAFAIFKAQCQSAPSTFISNTEREVIANVTKVVKYIIGPMAQPNQDMIDLGLVSGTIPKTMKDVLVYLEIIKTIARGIPEVINKFTKIITLPNGKKISEIDEITLNKNITDRAIEFLKIEYNVTLFGDTNQTAVSTNTANAVPTNRVTPINNGPPLAANPDNNPNLANVVPATQTNAQSNVASPSNDGSVSLLDLMRMANVLN